MSHRPRLFDGASAWFDEGPGAALLAVEQRLCQDVFDSLHGQFAVEFCLTEALQPLLLEHSDVVARIAFSARSAREVAHPVRATYDDLPVSSNSLQLAVIHHVHQALPRQEQFLKEVERALAPGGLLVIHGLNPVGRSLRWRNRSPDWVVRWRSVRALGQNASHLGLELIRYTPLFTSTNLAERLGRRCEKLLGASLVAPLSAGYQLLLRKPRRTARIVSGRELARKPRAVPNAAPSAGMSPADAPR